MLLKQYKLVLVPFEVNKLETGILIQHKFKREVLTRASKLFSLNNNYLKIWQHVKPYIISDDKPKVDDLVYFQHGNIPSIGKVFRTQDSNRFVVDIGDVVVTTYGCSKVVISPENIGWINYELDDSTASLRRRVPIDKNYIQGILENKGKCFIEMEKPSDAFSTWVVKFQGDQNVPKLVEGKVVIHLNKETK